MAQTIFSNARLLLDGFDQLQPGHELLVEDNLIRAVSATPLPRTQAPPSSTSAVAR